MIFHVIDTSTRFPNASYLGSGGEFYEQFFHGFWLAFVMICCTVHTGYPKRLNTDHDSPFTSKRRKQLLDLNGVELRLSYVAIKPMNDIIN